jgi:hypothetical protein
VSSHQPFHPLLVTHRASTYERTFSKAFSTLRDKLHHQKARDNMDKVINEHTLAFLRSHADDAFPLDVLLFMLISNKLWKCVSSGESLSTPSSANRAANHPSCRQISIHKRPSRGRPLSTSFLLLFCLERHLPGRQSGYQCMEYAVLTHHQNDSALSTLLHADLFCAWHKTCSHSPTSQPYWTISAWLRLQAAACQLQRRGTGGPERPEHAGQ